MRVVIFEDDEIALRLYRLSLKDRYGIGFLEFNSLTSFRKLCQEESDMVETLQNEGAILLLDHNLLNGETGQQVAEYFETLGIPNVRIGISGNNQLQFDGGLTSNEVETPYCDEYAGKTPQMIIKYIKSANEGNYQELMIRRMTARSEHGQEFKVQ